jgi:cystathionine beta-lyase/cystathionine gamma-synthase
MKKAMDNADKLANALYKNQHVVKVNYPTVPNYPQKELAKKLFKDGYGCGAMLSFVMPDDRAKINDFMKRLQICHYAPTLGGVRTTMSHPATSSHRDLPDEQKKALGITEGLMRISVGIEEADDLIKDFNQALKAFD